MTTALGVRARRIPFAPASGARRRLVLVMAATTTVVEAAGIAGWLPTIPFGALDLPISLLPALGLAAACGDRLLGRSSIRKAAAFYWAAIAIMLPVLAILFLRNGTFPLWISLMGAATSEELIYRLAIPAVVAALLRAGDVRADRARVAALVLAGVWFILLPGHRDQMTSPAAAIPFIAFAALSAIIVYRSGSILPMAAGHAVVNMCTVLMWDQTVAAQPRGMALACVLGLLVVAYGKPRRLTLDGEGGLVDTITGLGVAAIDLRAGRPPTVTLTDGRELLVDPDAQLPKSLALHPLPPVSSAAAADVPVDVDDAPPVVAPALS